MPLPHKRGHFFLFQNCPRGKGTPQPEIIAKLILKTSCNGTNWQAIFQENNSQTMFPRNSLNHKWTRDM